MFYLYRSMKLGSKLKSPDLTLFASIRSFSTISKTELGGGFVLFDPNADCLRRLAPLFFSLRMLIAILRSGQLFLYPDYRDSNLILLFVTGWVISVHPEKVERLARNISISQKYLNSTIFAHLDRFHFAAR